MKWLLKYKVWQEENKLARLAKLVEAHKRNGLLYGSGEYVILSQHANISMEVVIDLMLDAREKYKGDNPSMDVAYSIVDREGFFAFYPVMKQIEDSAIKKEQKMGVFGILFLSILGAWVLSFVIGSCLLIIHSIASL